MDSKRQIKRVLIAHQSTIPHYRVPFYQAVERLRPRNWEFTVIYDQKEADKLFFMSPDSGKFNFKIKNSKSYIFNIFGRRLIFQTFPFTSLKYDLLIVGQAMNNVAYPISFIQKIFKKPIAYWGQGRDLYLVNNGTLKNLTENLKFSLTKLADGFFAYTDGVKSYLIKKGIKSEKIFPLQNTIDINEQRKVYEKLLPDREMMRRELDIEHNKVILYVGRFNKEKRKDILADTFVRLFKVDNTYKLLVVGGGDFSLFDNAIQKCGANNICLFGAIPENEIGKYFVISDLFVIPGSVGLNALQAMCYDLIPVVIDSPFQSPEYEYLNKNNALILNNTADAKQYADAIHNLFCDERKRNKIKSQIWNSIQNLTIENMAANFIFGINKLLFSKNDR